MKKKVALITGITGQDGSYLTQFLLKKNYIVHGIKRRTSLINTERLDHLIDNQKYTKNLFIHYGDIIDANNLVQLINKIKPNEIYNLAAQSHVMTSFLTPDYTTQVNSLGTLRVLEAIRVLGLVSHTKFYQASSSEMFGATPPPQSESTPFYPRSPYGAAKVYAYWITKNYREAYGMFACNGILFNHESPRRGETFVTRKITRAVARIKAGVENEVYLGNLEAVRDWGHAAEYVEGMWLMLQADKADDYVLATGTSTTVKEFVEYSFEAADLDWKEFVKFDEKYLRPTEVDSLIGDASKAKAQLAWSYKTEPRQLAEQMVAADIEMLKNSGSHWIDSFEWRY